MNLVIFGSRNFKDYNLFLEVINKFYTKENVSTLVCGMAPGADTLAHRWAVERNIPIIEIPADWETYGRAAGAIRNEAMAKIADEGFGFWDGASRGTTNMIRNCQKYNVALKVYRTDQKIMLDFS